MFTDYVQHSPLLFRNKIHYPLEIIEMHVNLNSSSQLYSTLRLVDNIPVARKQRYFNEFCNCL